MMEFIEEILKEVHLQISLRFVLLCCAQSTVQNCFMHPLSHFEMAQQNKLHHKRISTKRRSFAHSTACYLISKHAVVISVCVCVATTTHTHAKQSSSSGKLMNEQLLSNNGMLLSFELPPLKKRRPGRTMEANLHSARSHRLCALLWHRFVFQLAWKFLSPPTQTSKGC